ncbi:Hypothetical protein CCH01_016780 [Clostridium chauvoei JF4335]|nr:Hypothetical protein CCH01_016780 [Clostridium chauvoei JF4335]
MYGKICGIAIGGLFILFIYSLYIKEYMQAIMCIVFSIMPAYTMITSLKKK